MLVLRRQDAAPGQPPGHLIEVDQPRGLAPRPRALPAVDVIERLVQITEVEVEPIGERGEDRQRTAPAPPAPRS